MANLRNAARRKLSAFLGPLSRAALVTGLGLLAWPAFVFLESSYIQWTARTAFSNSTSTPKTAAADPGAVQSETIVPRTKPALGSGRFPPGALIAKIEIPRLGMSYALLEGTAPRTLDKSPGHVE